MPPLKLQHVSVGVASFASCFHHGVHALSIQTDKGAGKSDMQFLLQQGPLRRPQDSEGGQ